RLQPEALSHRRIAGAGETRRLVPRRPDEGIARLRRGKAQRVWDFAGDDFLVTNQPREDRQSRRVGGGPPGRAQRIAVQIEYRARPGVPAAVGIRIGGEELVQLAAIAIDDQHVPIAAGRGAPFDRRVGRHRVRPGVALVGVIEADRDAGLAARNDDERYAVRRAVIDGAEIRMHRLRRAYGRDIGGGIAVDRQRIDGDVPDVIRREHRTHREYRRRGGLTHARKHQPGGYQRTKR